MDQGASRGSHVAATRPRGAGGRDLPAGGAAGTSSPPLPETVGRIVSRARFLWERLEGGGSPAPASPGHPDDPGRRLLERWARAVGSREALERRLAWDGWDVPRVLAALGSPPEDPGEPVGNGWGLFLTRLVEALRQEIHRDDPPTFAAQAPPLPLRRLWEPVAALSLRWLRRTVPEGWRLLGPAAVEDLGLHLLRQVAELASPAASELFPAAAMGSPDAAMEEEPAGVLVPLFEAHPLLARQLCRLLETWIETNAEMLGRLLADRELLEERLAGGRPLGRVSGIDPGLSDRHAGGRRVAVLRFESGLAVVYKPRDCRPEAAFSRVLSWLAGQGLDPAPPRVLVLPREGYGWMEYVRREEPADPEGVRRWFRAAGALLATAHLLGTTDLHMANVVAASGGPVAVDVETLLQPGLRHPLAPAAETGGTTGDTILTTGLVSFVQRLPDGTGSREMGGLLGREGSPTGRGDPRPDGGTAPVPARANELRYRGRPVDPREHLEEIRSGFEDACRLFAGHRDELLEGGGFVPHLAGLATRVVFRPTHLYARVLRTMLQPPYQRDPLAASLLLEALNRPLLGLPTPPPLWPLVEVERRALEQLDVPRFSVPVDAAMLAAPSEDPLPGTLECSGMEAFRRRLLGLDAQEIRRQVRILEHLLRRPRVTVRDDSARSADDGSAWGATLPRETITAVALELAEGVASGLPREAPAPVAGGDPVPGAAGDTSLYGGACGPALLFAAAWRITREDRWAELARATLDRLPRAAEDPGLAREPLGACHGLGGLLHTLVVAAHLLEDPGLLERAHRIAGALSPERIGRDQRFDVEGGAAGALLALLSLEAVSPRPGLAARARACASHLLDHQIPSGEDAGGWPSVQGWPVAGFAHGASGILTALARLHGRRPEAELAGAIRRALAFERRLFDPGTGNWPLWMRSRWGGGRRALPMVAWCHGAPGVALARGQVVHTSGDPQAARELETALATTTTTRDRGPDHLCCGILGRTDVAMTMGLMFDRPDLVRGAEEMAGMVVRRILEKGTPSLDGRGDGDGRHPGFFRGLSGVAYQLLRTVHPGILPSVLFFEPPSGAAVP